MFKYVKRIDAFTKNIIIVFLGTSLVNVFNLFYQVLIAHRISSIDFAGFNSLLAIFTLLSSPLTTLQAGVAKYIAEFNAQNQFKKIQALLSSLIRMVLPLAIITLVYFCFLSAYIMDKLKISTLSAGYILAALLALSWIAPIFSGALQGLEFFVWLVALSIGVGALKLIFAFVFISLGFNITGALSALLLVTLIGIIVSIFPLKYFLSPVFSRKENKISNDINFPGFFSYLFPVFITTFCFMLLVNSDMILVKYFLAPPEAGFYSLAQMVGKIFLFLPGAISMVMFPKTAGLKAKDLDTSATLKRSLLYGCILCLIASIVYNLSPFFILKVLTGKAFAESVLLGRFFSLSMSFFTLLYILIAYLLSIKELAFIKYLILFTLLQFLAIKLFHRDLIQIQLILCMNSILLFFIHLALVYRKRKPVPNSFLA